MTTTTAQLLLNLEQCQVNCLVNTCAGITSRVWTQGDLSNKDASQTMFAIGWVCPAVYPRTRLKPVFKAQIFSSSSLPMPQHSTVRTRSVRATKITKSICQLSPLEECREDFGHAHFLEDVRVLRHGFKTRNCWVAAQLESPCHGCRPKSIPMFGTCRKWSRMKSK